MLVVLDGPGIAAPQLVPEIVHPYENAEHVRLQLEGIGGPALLQIGDLVAAHAAVVELERAIGMRRERRRGHEQRVAAAEPTRLVRLGRGAIAPAVGDRVSLKQDDRPFGRGPAGPRPPPPGDPPRPAAAPPPPAAPPPRRWLQQP